MDTWLVFSFGSFLFWTLVVVASIIILGFMEYEKGFWATVTLIGTVCLLHYFGGKQIFPWVAAHKLHTFYYVLAYFGLGTIWGINKWWFFVRHQRDMYDETRALFTKSYDAIMERRATAIKDLQLEKEEGRILSDDPRANAREWARREADLDRRPREVAFKEDWSEIVASGGYSHRIGFSGSLFVYRPSYRKHKGKIMMWMTYWPWSFLWTMINDPIKKMFNTIIDSLRGLFTSISNRAFQGTDEHTVKVVGADEDE